MKSIEGIGLREVQGVYGGAEGDLWELIMGEQIHIGGFASSMALAEKAGIGAGMKGVDLCCCNGGGMRFLVKFRNVSAMQGVDATDAVVKRGIERCRKQGVSDKVSFTFADVCKSGLPNAAFDFVWGEDAWCYVVDKARLISEAARLAKKGGTIAFTDWIEGATPMAADEAKRYMTFMKFPNVQDLNGYSDLLKANGCDVTVAEDTGLFAPYVDLYLNMLNKQLTYDALRIIDFNMELMGAMANEMVFMQGLAKVGKIAQGRFVARKK